MAADDSATSVLSYLMDRVKKLEAENAALLKKLTSVRNWIEAEHREQAEEMRTALAAFDAIDRELAGE